MHIDMTTQKRLTRSDTSDNPTRASSNVPTNTQIRYPVTRVGQVRIGESMGAHTQTDKNLVKTRSDEYDTQTRGLDKR